MSDDKPPEKATVEFEKVPAWAISLAESIKKVGDEQRMGFASQDARFDRVEADVTSLVEDGKIYNTRLTTIEVRFDESERRMMTHSLRAKQSSEVDMKTEAALAAEIVARQELAKDVAATKADVVEIKAETVRQTAMLDTLISAGSKLAANPIVRSIAVMIGTAILTWLGMHEARP